MNKRLLSLTVVLAVVFSIVTAPILTTSAATAYPPHVEKSIDGSGRSQSATTLESGKGLPPLGNYDIRATGGAALSAIIKQHSTLSLNSLASFAQLQVAAIQSGLADLKVVSPGAEATFSPMIGAVEVVRNRQGALTAAATNRAGRDIVLDYLRAHQTVYGLNGAEIENLHYLGESVSRDSGLRMVRLEQQVNGLPVFQSETRFILDRDGRLIGTLGLMVPQASRNAGPLINLIQPQHALQAAMQSVRLTVDVSAMKVTRPDQSTYHAEIASTDPRLSGPVNSQLVYFPVAPGVLIPAWSQVTFTSGSADWYTLVDAQTGALLWRKNIRSDSDPAAPASISQKSGSMPTAIRAAAKWSDWTRPLFGPAAPTASTQEARFSVYVQADGSTPADSPAPHSPTNVTPGSGTQFPEITRTIVSMLTVQNPTASPNGWISDGITTTTGNNVDAYLDTDADDVPDAGLLDVSGRPAGNLDTHGNNRDFLGSSPRDFSYAPAPLGGNPDAGDAPTGAAFQRGAVTQLFYLANWYHDQLYALGFDEAAGNYQTNNFGRGGTGGDPVLAETQDGSGTNNANFSTPPDGTSGRMQMYLFDFPTPERDGSLDAEIVLHEMTHGLSNRLIGDGNGLIWDEGGGMGEGWSDFYALSLLNNTNADDPNGEYATGAYATYQLGGLTDNYLYGIRRFPYTTDNSINPLTWADVDDITYNESGGIASSPLAFGDNGALEVHNVGEIWALSLWEVRSRVIADPAGANGDVPTGNQTMLQIATDALKLTPINPSFTAARDALIDADCATNACANEQSIWAGFADRGLGYKAVAPLGQSGIQSSGGHVGIGESFAVPYLDANGVTIDDSLGNVNGAIDPGEPINLTVNLLNPWRNASQGVASVTATLTTTTPGVTILNGQASYGAIAANSSANGTPFSFLLDPSANCGQSIKFTLQTSSSLGVTSTTFTVRVGAAAGTGAPITYTRAIAGGLSIPDANFNGVTDQQIITDDYEIADLNFRVDNLQHTFTGDLAVTLKAPNGYGTDLIYLRGIFIGDSDGDNFINTVIDNQSINDLNLTGSADAPFTGDWAPAFNSVIWSLFGIPNLYPDPVGQLNRLNGLSTQGVWQVHVTDEAFADTGKLNTWSLIVTPKAFTCSAFTPADLTMSKTVAPSLAIPGQTVTYTLGFANSGGFTATNVSLADNVPAQLTNLSVTNTGSLITATVGVTYAWQVADLAPGAGGIITLTGQVDPGLRPPVTFTNTAAITSTAFELVVANNTASASTQVPCTAPATVVNNADSGAGSLRQAITNICPGGTINFDNDYTITLTSDQLTIDRDVTIDGTGHNVTISGGDSVRVFDITGGTVLLNKLTITHGTGSGFEGGGIYNQGTLTVSNSTLSNNSGTGDSGGGGIYNSGNLTVSNSTLSNNAGNRGAGISNDGTLLVVNSTFSGNNASFDNSGGGISNNATAVVKNTIIANSTGDNCAGSLDATSANNLADDGTCVSGFTQISAAELALGTLTGTPAYFPLLPTSAAIDTGDPATCADASTVKGLDQRGQPRNDLQCDIGAFELKYADSHTVELPVSDTTVTTFGPALMGIQRDATPPFTDPGVITVTREAWHIQGPESIGALWAITPTATSGFSLTLQACYTDAELGSLSAQEGNLRFWRSDGITYTQIITAPALSTLNGYHCAALSGIRELSRWTLAIDTPTAITLNDLRATSPIEADWGWWLLLGLGVIGAALLLLRRRAA